jgi:hypothetical protein
MIAQKTIGWRHVKDSLLHDSTLKTTTLNCTMLATHQAVLPCCNNKEHLRVKLGVNNLATDLLNFRYHLLQWPRRVCSKLTSVNRPPLVPLSPTFSSSLTSPLWWSLRHPMTILHHGFPLKSSIIQPTQINACSCATHEYFRNKHTSVMIHSHPH